MTTLTPRHKNVGVDSGNFTEGIIMLLTSGSGDSDDNDNDFSQTLRCFLDSGVFRAVKLCL